MIGSVEGIRRQLAEISARREAIAKAYQHRGITASGGEIMTPGHVEAQDFRRGYETAGHAAESPMSGPPRSFPVLGNHPQAEDFTGHAARETEGPPGTPRESPPPGEGQKPIGETPPGVSGPVPHAAKSVPRVELSPFAGVGGNPGPLTRAHAAHQAMVNTATPVPGGENR